MRTSADRVKGWGIPYWVDIYGTLKEVSWDKKPDVKHRPLTWADRPIDIERLKALWVEAEGKPKKFARLIEAEHGIRKWEVEKENE